MYLFGKRSLVNLGEAHINLQRLFNAVIQVIDCTVIHGHRSPKEQFEIFKKGRVLKNGVWVIRNKKKVCTYKDGTIKKSMHNHKPAMAVDVVPYFANEPHIRWEDKEKFYFLAGVVAAKAKLLGIAIRWGGNWDGDDELHDQSFMDLGHFELVTF